MTQSSRQRGKLIKKLIKQAKAANRAEVSKAVEANLSSKPKPLSPIEKLAKATGPQRFERGVGTSTAKDRLKGGSYGVGFQGPRGYGTPKGTVGKREADGLKLVPGTAPLTLPGDSSKRFNRDDYRDTERQPSRLLHKKRETEKRWKTIDLNDG